MRYRVRHRLDSLLETNVPQGSIHISAQDYVSPLSIALGHHTTLIFAEMSATALAVELEYGTDVTTINLRIFPLGAPR